MADDTETTTTLDPSPLADAVGSKSAVKDAGAAFLASLSKEATPEATPEPAPTPEPKAERERGPDGKFVKTNEPTAEAEPETPEEPVTAEAEEPEPEAEPEEPKTTVVLKGLGERGEEDVEIEVADPVVAERLRRLQNDGLRGKEYREKLAAVAEKESEYQELQVQMEANPVGFLVQMIEPSRQVEVATALLTEHFDALQPVIEQFFESPAEVLKAKLAARESARASEKQMAEQTRAMQTARTILSATEALIPEGVEHGVAAQFMRDAERDLIDAVRAGEKLAPDAVPRVLAKRLKMYGFAPNGTAPMAAVTRTVPAGDRPSVTVASAKAAQERTAKVQAQRKAAQAIPPAGRGTVSVRRPVVSETATVEQASKALLKNGVRTWADYTK